MKLGTTILVTALCAASAVNVSEFSKPYYFHQILDHFDLNKTECFKQRYYKYDGFFREGAPIFLQIGGEVEILGMGPNFPNELAMKYHGFLYALEHRYYGKSVPASFSGRDPRYLSSEQALEDIAHFIEAQKEQYPDSPWIVSGCSYAGNLATWMRQKYPHLVQGAIAGSAPLLVKADFYEYFEVIGEVLKGRAPLCHQNILEANQELAMLAKSPNGQRKLAKIFGVPSYSSDDSLKFHYYLAEAVLDRGVIQDLHYFKPYCSEVCYSVRRYTHEKSVLDILVNFTMPRSQETSGSFVGASLTGHAANMWLYQICHEFGYWRTLSSKKQPFGIWPNVNTLFRLDCNQWNISMETLEDNIRKTNLRYGGKTPNVTNVVFMHGSNDPWHPLGVLWDLSSSARAFVFQGLSHCEMYGGRKHFKAADERYAEWMKIYDEIDSIVRSWIK
ncbi:putative serine protease K12H4.7 [Anabrus simplex]|uniref:putative serine protease K12H4.7 n=1 Tax=Anabrus simplex TaxID=316456 RepID=UPI0035A2F242